MASCCAGLLCAIVFLAAPVAHCQDSTAAADPNQQNQSAQPIPAYQSPFSVGTDDQNTDENSQAVQPDTRPLTGAQYISMENVSNQRSYWQPRVDVTGSADSNPEESPTNSGWGSWTSFLAGVDLHRKSGTSQMMLTYTGGGMYSNESDVPNGTIQELGVSDNITFRRSVFSVFDQLSYLPQASLGFGGVGGLPLTGIGSVGLGSGFTTGQSVLTGQGQNLANSSIAQLETFLTSRSSITMTGGYSLLHFFGNDLVDSGDIIFQGGYNYQLTRHDTVAALYNFSDFRYSSLSQSIYTHTIQGSYGRRVTGRLAFQIAAGPEVAIFNQGALSSSAPGGTGAGSSASNSSSTHLYWSLNSSVNYQYQRTALGLNYSHGVGAGSGVLAGSLEDIVTGSWTRKMSRTFSSGLSAGYSRNSALPITSGQASGQNYDYWFAGATFAHPLSETVALNFSYQMQYQTSNQTFQIGNSSGTSVIRHLISVGFSWHQRPLDF